MLDLGDVDGLESRDKGGCCVVLFCIIMVLSLRCFEKEAEGPRDGERAGLVGARPAGDISPVGRGEASRLVAAASDDDVTEVRREAGGLTEVMAEMRRPANLPDCERGRRVASRLS